MSTERLAKALTHGPPNFMTGGTVPKSSSFSYQVTTPSHHLTPAVTMLLHRPGPRTTASTLLLLLLLLLTVASGRSCHTSWNRWGHNILTALPSIHIYIPVHLYFLHIIHVSGVETRAGQPGQQLQPARREGEGGHGVQSHVQIYLDQGGIT